MTTARPVAMRQALHATAAASSVSVTGARRDRGERDPGPAQQLATPLAAGRGVLAVRQRRARQGAERQLGVDLVERVPAAAAEPVGLEQPGPQAPGLDGQTLAGQLAAALAGRLVAGLLPDRPGRDGEDRAAPGPEQPARRAVGLAPARPEQAERHVDSHHAGPVPVEHAREGLVHANHLHPEQAGPSTLFNLFGPCGAIQADRDPAAPAGVHSGYPHTATVTHPRRVPGPFSGEAPARRRAEPLRFPGGRGHDRCRW